MFHRNLWAGFVSQGIAIKISGCSFQRHNHRHRHPRLPLETLTKGTSRHTPPVACQTPAPLHLLCRLPLIFLCRGTPIKTCSSMGHQPFPPQKFILLQFEKSAPLPQAGRGLRHAPDPFAAQPTGARSGISSSRFRSYCHQHLRDTSQAWQSKRLFASHTSAVPFCRSGLPRAATAKGWCYSALHEEQVKHRNTNAQRSGSATQKASGKAITLNNVQRGKLLQNLYQQQANPRFLSRSYILSTSVANRTFRLPIFGTLRFTRSSTPFRV